MEPEAAQKPILHEPFPDIDPIWTCPKTGLKVPKDPNANLRYRSRLLAQAERDEGLQRDLYAASAKSILFWTNTFVFTFKLKEVDPETGKERQVRPGERHVPFVTWAIQDRHLTEIEQAIDKGYDLLTDKSRDMGASWNHIVAIHHKYLFEDNFLALELSRTEDYVDKKGNPKCLFWKHDYINLWLPPWMFDAETEQTRVRLSFFNETRNSRIDGESTTRNAARGDRRNCVLLDEFAAVEGGAAMRSATSDVTTCRLVNSTPQGAGTEYTRWRKSGQIKVSVLPWWEHPEKGRGRYVEQDEITKKWRIRSPYYDRECERRSPQEVAQELDMDHVGSGDVFFEPHILDQHKAMFGREPLSRRGIDFMPNVATDAIPNLVQRKNLASVRILPNGPWKFWTRLINGRLDQTNDYILGIDISKGMGASNSVISVLCVQTVEKVAEWADANTPPYEFASVAVASALWIGGRSSRLPLMVWEANGSPGWDFGRQVVKKLCYPNYFVDHASGTLDEKKSKRYGWHSNTDKKGQVLGSYRRALAHGGFINHSVPALEEAELYVYYDDGGIGPASLVEESSSARKTHGDRVIADSLTLVGLEKAPRVKRKLPSAPQRSAAFRRQLKERQKQKERDSERWDNRKAVSLSAV